MLSLLWQICDIIGLIYIVANSLFLKNDVTIWSHCFSHATTGDVGKSYTLSTNNIFAALCKHVHGCIRYSQTLA